MRAVHFKRASLLLLLFGSEQINWAQQATITAQVVLAKQSGEAKTADASGLVMWLVPLAPSAPHEDARVVIRQTGLRLVQKHKAFAPHLMVVQVGSVVDFPNRDPFFHNVFSLFEGKRFDLGLYEAGSSRAVRFDRPGVCYIFCNIHPEMSAVIVVVNTPYYAVSDRSGVLTIQNVPAERYELHVWNEGSLPEALSDLTREVSVREDTHSLGILRVREAPRLSLAHKNKYGRDYENPTPPNPVY